MDVSLIAAGTQDLAEAIAQAASSGGSNGSPGGPRALGHLFAGLSGVNLHGNIIEAIPIAAALPALPALKRLDLSSNCVRDLDCSGLAAAAPVLEELDLAANDVSTVRGVLSLTSLRVLRLPYNSLTSLAFLAEPSSASGAGAGGHVLLPCLREVDLRDNLIASVEQVAYLAAAPRLATLSLQAPDGSAGNPVCCARGYTGAVARACPNLVSFDGRTPSDAVRAAARRDSVAVVRALEAVATAAEA